MDDGRKRFPSHGPGLSPEEGEEEEREQGRISCPGGAVRGTAYHRALELLSFKDAASFGDLKAQLDAIKAQDSWQRRPCGWYSPAFYGGFSRRPWQNG